MYNPANKSWMIVGQLNTPRSGHTATFLNVGDEILIVGGFDDSGHPTASAEIILN
jgi:hypothetical protein